MELVLQKFSAQDFADYFRLVNDLRVMAMITERSIAQDEAERDFATLLADNMLHPELGQFRVLDAEGQFVGLGKIAITRDNPAEAELGYLLLPEHWGRGIGRVLAPTLLARAERTPTVERLFAIIDPAHLVSRRILTNNGFTSREFKSFDGLPGEILERACRLPA